MVKYWLFIFSMYNVLILSVCKKIHYEYRLSLRKHVKERNTAKKEQETIDFCKKANMSVKWVGSGFLVSRRKKL